MEEKMAGFSMIRILSNLAAANVSIRHGFQGMKAENSALSSILSGLAGERQYSKSIIDLFSIAGMPRLSLP
jgi:hypothetical protein